MRVRVLYFAQLRSVATDTEELELPEGATIRTLYDKALEKYPELAKFEGSILCARNREWATYDTILEDGDEVGIMPPVSGG